MSEIETQPFQPLSETPKTEMKLGKFKASRMLVYESWAILKQDKEIMWFPVLSVISSLIAILVMGILFFIFVMDADIHAFDEGFKSSSEVFGYILFFMYYTVLFYIIYFYQAGMFIIIHGRMNGSDLTFKDGIAGAQEVAGKIFVWSLISATVGVLLRIISDRSKLVGKIVASLFGAAWNILTYFSLPSLVIGKTSVKDSFRMSADTIRKTWGETFIINIGMGLFLAIFYILITVVSVIIILLAPTTAVILSVGSLFVVSILTLSIISSSLGIVFKVALFEYARTGIIPKGFSPELLQNAIKK
jgi:hypothetical protein